VASYLEARQYRGRWLLRIEDIDPPRMQPGATDRILEALEAFQFQWDDEVRLQSGSRAAHEAAVQGLLDRELAYACSCSRSEILQAEPGDLGPVYPGTCRQGAKAGATAIRVLTNDSPISFTDRLQGPQIHRLESESGDFVIRRKDELMAYQLAVVVDDEDQGITDIVRGIDLLASTPRQIWLQKLLGFRTPNYTHIPVAINTQGQKLSKSSGADDVLMGDCTTTLVAALVALEQHPPEELIKAPLSEVWGWAFSNWNVSHLLGKKALLVPASSLI